MYSIKQGNFNVDRGIFYNNYNIYNKIYTIKRFNIIFLNFGYISYECYECYGIICKIFIFTKLNFLEF
jgi:hypothetical protein